MLEEKILTDYFYVLDQLHLGKKPNLDELINMILINKYNLTLSSCATNSVNCFLRFLDSLESIEQPNP